MDTINVRSQNGLVKKSEIGTCSNANNTYHKAYIEGSDTLRLRRFMSMQFNNFSSSEAILKHNQLEALKSLSMLLVREINSLDAAEKTLEKEVENEKPICLLKELERIETHMMRCALIRTMGHQTKAAWLLGMKLTTFNMKMRRYKIDLTELT